MERTSFLNALPFLFPLTSTPWPPPLPSESRERARGRREAQLSNQSLSIEPIRVPNSADSHQGARTMLGPAFFINKNIKPTDCEDSNSFDPAMCRIDLVLHSSLSMDSTPESATKNTSATRNTSRYGTPTQLQEVTEWALFMKSGGHVYQVDLTQLRQVEVLPAPDDGASSKPPCLLVALGGICAFRIFSLQNPGDQNSQLNAMKEHLAKLLTLPEHQASTVPDASVSGLASPSGSSAFSSSNEFGQREFSHHSPPRGEQASKDSKTDSQRSNHSSLEPQRTAENSSSGSTDATQLCRTALNDAHHDMQRLHGLLSHTTSLQEASANKDSPTVQESQEQIGTLLTSTPAHFSSSYCTAAQLSEAVQAQNQRISDCHVEVEGIVKSLWPTSKRSRSIDTNNSHASPSKRLRPPVPSEDIASQIEQLQRKHRETVRAKYALTTLPKRG